MLLFFLCVYSVYLVRYVTIPVLSIIAPRKDEGLLSGATTCHKEREGERERKETRMWRRELKWLHWYYPGLEAMPP